MGAAVERMGCLLQEWVQAEGPKFIKCREGCDLVKEERLTRDHLVGGMSLESQVKQLPVSPRQETP